MGNLGTSSLVQGHAAANEERSHGRTWRQSYFLPAQADRWGRATAATSRTHEWPLLLIIWGDSAPGLAAFSLILRWRVVTPHAEMSLEHHHAHSLAVQAP